MDVHVHGNPRLHFNGCHQTKDDGLQFLSTEEKECIQFFEETIDSLEEGFDNSTGLSSRRTTHAENLRTMSNSALNPVLATDISPRLMQHDIIDLVHSTPNFTMPDFQSLAVTPEAHYEMKPKRDSMASVVSSPATSSDASKESSHQPPPGSIPTPVVIANRIAEHQGTSGVSPSALVKHRRSLESKRDPPMPARAGRLPSNISVARGSCEISPHSLATAATSFQERRSQMLANLPAGVHPLEGGEPACVRNLPMHSVSFRDPTPNKSRMEALSKLGLTGPKTSNSPTSVVTKGSSSTTSSHSSSPNKVSSNANSAVNKVSISNRAHISNNIGNTASNSIHDISQRKNSGISVTHSSPSSSYEPKPKSETSPSNLNYYGRKTAAITPMTKDPIATVNQERRSSTTPASAEVTQSDFNSYGGKTIMLNPTMSAIPTKSASSFAATPKPAETQFNNYGGRSRVINPSVHADVPDELNCAPSHSPPNTITPGDPNRSRYTSELNSYNAKPKAQTSSHPDQVYQPMVRTRPATVPSTTTSRPQCPTGSQRPRPDPVPPEILSKPAPSFRTQGITVQFSGRGVTDEARRDALRKLGLLKNTS